MKAIIKPFVKMDKEEIFFNFSNRFEFDGYHTKIKHLAEIEASGNNEAYIEESERIAEEYNQSANTVLNDVARL